MTDATTAAGNLDRRVNTRLTVALFLFLLWGTAVMARLGQLMILEHDRAVADLDRQATFTGLVPALRGRLLDREGRVLAWSERRFRISWHVPENPENARMQQLRFSDLPTGTQTPIDPSSRRRNAPPAPVVVAEDLTAEQAARWQSLCASLPTLELNGYCRRLRVPDDGLSEVLGTLAYEDNGMAIGLSGAEAAHDRILRGQPGLFQVMLDKHGNWIPETWRSIRQARAGFDVHLPIRTTDSSDLR